MNAKRLAKIRATLLDYQSALVDAGASEAAPTLADAFCEVYVRDVGDLLAVMDALSGQVIWHYKAGTDVNAVKAALANSDKVNIAVQAINRDGPFVGKLIDPPAGKERWEIGDSLPDLTEPDTYLWVLLEAWKDGDQWMAKSQRKQKTPMVIMDEAVGLPADYWDKCKTMLPCACKSLLNGHEPGCPHA